ncbi:hypothetical protein BJV78DRAFT_1203520, partial [Lactifluus subvellereus]
HLSSPLQTPWSSLPLLQSHSCRSLSNHTGPAGDDSALPTSVCATVPEISGLIESEASDLIDSGSVLNTRGCRVQTRGNPDLS